MLFQTPEFLIFILLVMAGIGLIRRAPNQHIMLLLASYVFYGWWDVRFLMLIVVSSVIDYAASLGIQDTKLSPRKLLGISALMAFSTLFFLVPDWPQIQESGLVGSASLSELLIPSWEGAGTAIAISALFAIAGPILYQLFFKLPDQRRRKAFLMLSLAANLGILCFFKYFNFFMDNATGVASMLGMSVPATVLSVALPVGISFYTFQTMSYTIDAYRGKIEAERSFVRLALYVAYFPQLVAGPILRPDQFLPSLDRPWALHSANIYSGFHLILIGLFKKVLIADNVAPLVNVVLADPYGQPSLSIMLATALFAVQIYCDFSGYTDIARGVSRMFGVEIPLNFNFPYFSTSIIDFWRRWHISLSSWLRDYLYIPLGGSRYSIPRTYLNLMITMVLGGLWHGAAWNFVIWGIYQGVLLCLNRVLQAILAGTFAERILRSRLGTVFRWACAAYLWMLGWLIFRVTDLDALLYCMKKFLFFDGSLSITSMGLGRGSPFISLGAATFFVLIHTAGYFSKLWSERLDSMPLILRIFLYAALGMLFFYGWPMDAEPFIYFQF